MRREWLVLLVFSAAGCTPAGDVEPSPVGVGTAGGRGAGSEAPAASGQAPGGSSVNPAPVLDPGEAESPVRLLPGDVGKDNAGAARSDADSLDVFRDAGADAGDAGDAGANARDGGLAAPDAGTPDAPDAAAPNAPDAGATPGAPAGTPDASAPVPPAPCPGVVFEGGCYGFFADPLSWYAAEERCIEWGGHLASVESLQEDAFIGAWPALLGVPALDGSGLWLGGTDAERDGDFRWWDDRALSYAGWASDQPNNGSGVDCVEKRNDATQRWYDRRCIDDERYVCERPE